MSTIVVIGPPGAGKGTKTGRAMKVIPNMVSISTGNLLREKGFDLSSGKLISDEIVMNLLKEKLEELAGKDLFVLLDGVPRNLQQAEQMEKEQIKVDKVLYLPLTEEEALRRAEDRLTCQDCNAIYTESDFNPPKEKGVCDVCKGKLVRRADDSNPETVLKRLQIYREKTEPLLDWYADKDIPVNQPKTQEKFNELILSCK